MKRIAAPMVGGIFTSFLLGLLVYPAVYDLWKRQSMIGEAGHSEFSLPMEDETLVFSIEGDWSQGDG